MAQPRAPKAPKMGGGMKMPKAPKVPRVPKMRMGTTPRMTTNRAPTLTPPPGMGGIP